MVLGNQPLGVDEDEKIAEHPYEYLVDFLVGQTLPKRYRVVSLLAKNRFFALYKAVYEPVDQIVVLRVFRTNSCRDEYNYRRFQQEVRRLAALNHKNIASVMDYGVLDEGLPYLIQEYLHGSSLEQVLHAVNRISVDRTVFVGAQVAAALSHAHEYGIFHEMLTPADIHVVRDKDEGDIIKVSSFGLLSVLSKIGLDLSDPYEKVDAINTAAYMSPEQCTGRDVDGRTDIYSLGAVLYECVAGQAPFVNPSPAELMRMHKSSRYPALSYVRSEANLPPYLIEIIEKCLQKDPSIRYQFAQNVEEDITVRRSPEERERMITREVAASDGAVLRAAARVQEASTSTMVPLAKVTAIFAAIVLLGFATWGLLSFVSRFANEGVWKGALEAAHRDYYDRKYTHGVEQASNALKEAEKFAQPDLRVAVTLNELVAGQIILGQFAEAAENLNRALEMEKNTSADTRTKARTQQLMSEVEYGRHHFADAEIMARKALELWQHVSDPKPSEMLAAHLTLLRTLCAEEKLADAKAIYESAKTIAASSSEIPEQVSGDLRQSLAMLTLVEGDSQTAEHVLKDLLSSRQRNFGLKDPLSAETLVLLGRVYHKQKKYEQAESVLENAFGILKDAYGEEVPLTAEVPGVLAMVQDESGDLDEAEKNYRLSVELQEKIWGARSPRMVPSIGALGRFLRQRRNQVNAADVYETEIKEIEALEQKTAATSSPR